MKIEGNPIEVAAMKAFNEGGFEEGRRLEGEFVRQDHLPHCFEKIKVNPWYKDE